MDTTCQTDQGYKDIISPGTGNRYEQRLTWVLDATTHQPIIVQADYTF